MPTRPQNQVPVAPGRFLEMFEPKRSSQHNLINYIGARVTDEEEAWLRAEMKRRRITMSDLIRTALATLKSSSP